MDDKNAPRITGRPSPRWSFMQGFQVQQDGRPYLDRLRIIVTPLFSVLLHRIHVPDTGRDPHDHPWPFLSLILSGSYTETVWDYPAGLTLKCGTCATPDCRDGSHWRVPDPRISAVPYQRDRRRWSLHSMRLHQAHKITSIDGVLWTLVITGRQRPSWRFWTADGPVDWKDYPARGEDSRADWP